MRLEKCIRPRFDSKIINYRLRIALKIVQEHILTRNFDSKKEKKNESFPKDLISANFAQKFQKLPSYPRKPQKISTLYQISQL